MHRRRFLAAGATAATVALAGCRSMFQTRSSRSPPLVDTRPKAVYYPTHVEGMQMIGRKRAGDFRVALTYSFPHRFWLINGDRRTKVELDGSTSVHLMVTVWDPDTGTVVPNSSIETTISAGGDRIVQKRLWPMLSQNMGVHAGDNVALDGNGTYSVDLDIGAVQARTTGDFQGQFGRAETSFEFEFDRAKLEDISFERLPDKQGSKGAVDPMDMEMVPVARTPKPGALPGSILGTPKSGDAVLATTVLDSPPAGIGGDGNYLAVSARTPYNRYPIPFMGVEATQTRGGEQLFDGDLQPTFDSDLGYHYGAAVSGTESGDEFTLSVTTPPQIARHEGYEMAFFEFSDVSVSV